MCPVITTGIEYLSSTKRLTLLLYLPYQTFCLNISLTGRNPLYPGLYFHNSRKSRSQLNYRAWVSGCLFTAVRGEMRRALKAHLTKVRSRIVTSTFSIILLYLERTYQIRNTNLLFTALIKATTYELHSCRYRGINVYVEWTKRNSNSKCVRFCFSKYNNTCNELPSGFFSRRFLLTRWSFSKSWWDCDSSCSSRMCWRVQVSVSIKVVFSRIFFCVVWGAFVPLTCITKEYLLSIV